MKKNLAAPKSSHFQPNVPFRLLTPHLIPTHLILQPLAVRLDLRPFALPLLHEPQVHKLPLATHGPEDPLRSRDVDVALLPNDPDGSAQDGPFLRAALGLFEFLFVTVDVVDDGDVFGAVEVDGPDEGKLGRRQVKVHDEAH